MGGDKGGLRQRRGRGGGGGGASGRRHDGKAGGSTAGAGAGSKATATRAVVDGSTGGSRTRTSTEGSQSPERKPASQSQQQRRQQQQQQQQRQREYTEQQQQRRSSCCSWPQLITLVLLFALMTFVSYRVAVRTKLYGSVSAYVGPTPTAVKRRAKALPANATNTSAVRNHPEDYWMCRIIEDTPRMVYTRLYSRYPGGFSQLISRLAKLNEYRYIMSKYRHADLQLPAVRERVANAIISSDEASMQSMPVTDMNQDAWHSFFWESEMSYIDFSEFGLPQPAYMSLIRNPLERFAADFLFDSSITGRRDKEAPFFPSCTRNTTLNGCLTAVRQVRCAVSRDACGDVNAMTRSFCGYHSDCANPSSPQALARALHNLQYRYAFVGVLEYMATSLTMGERLLPFYLTDASALGACSARKNTPMLAYTEESLKQVSPENMEFLRAMNANDIKLYQFAVNLLRRRSQLCQIPLFM